MKKKEKSVRSPTTSAATIADDGATDLKSVIRDHSLFFDRLVELIPAKFYLPTDDAAKPWFQGLNKAAKQAAKLQTKDNLKKARRQRLDPGKSQISTLELLKQTLENEKQTNDVKIEGDDDEKDEQDKINPIVSLGGDDRSVTYEELRQRLHRRIEELRGNRGSSESLRNQKRDNYQKKRKLENVGKDESGSHGKGGNVKETEGKIEKDVTEAIKGVEFGKVKLGGEEESGKKNKKRKLSKEKELQQAKKLEDAKKDPEKGEVVAKKHSWKAAVSRAAGVKVHDDPKLLKHSMKKEKKRHERSAGKWKDRVESREKMKEEKQQKRAGNISERIHQKKMRKIAKREKKLMRPGFEGRKEGYINEN